jgi:hypothetical protein
MTGNGYLKSKVTNGSAAKNLGLAVFARLAHNLSIKKTVCVKSAVLRLVPAAIPANGVKIIC